MAVKTEREADLDTAALVRTVVGKIPAMVAYWDKNQVCRFANRAYEKWFGVPPEAVIGRTMKELLGPLYPLNWRRTSRRPWAVKSRSSNARSRTLHRARRATVRRTTFRTS